MYDGLAGMPFPAPRFSFPTKDEMGDFLESYARRFDLPVETGVRVDRLSRTEGGRFLVEAGARRFEARQVVVAMSGFQKPRVPSFARDLSSGTTQLTSFDYRNPAQLRDGAVLVVGAGNSGAEIALDVVRGRRTLLAGRDVGQVPFRIEGLLARVLVPLIFRVVFHRVLTIRSPFGRKVRTRMLTAGGPRIRTKQVDLVTAGVQLVPRVAEVRDGNPVLADGRVLEVSNVIWCTGLDAGFSWIDIDVHGELEPRHNAGVAEVPGLYFLGLMFLYAGSSVMVHGVGRDAARLAGIIAQKRSSLATDGT
jgi:putative flavoprotein involved in K+ transport